MLTDIRPGLFLDSRISRRNLLFKAVPATVASLAVASKLEIRASADNSVDTSITDRRVIAGIFGWDQFSRDARFWHLAADGGWVFDIDNGIDDNGQAVPGDGNNHGILIGGTDGIGGELLGTMRGIQTPYGEFTGLIAAHRNAGLVEASIATIYRHKNAWDGWVNIVDWSRNNRKPGQIWMPINEAPGITNQGDIPLFAIGTNVDAARMFGGDPNNWTVVDQGPQGDRFATITSPNGTNVGIKLWSPEQQIWPNGSMWPVAQGEIAKSGSLPSRFAAHPSVGEIFGPKITVRLTTNPGAAWRNSLSAIRAEVRTQGGGINVLPIIR